MTEDIYHKMDTIYPMTHQKFLDRFKYIDVANKEYLDEFKNFIEHCDMICEVDMPDAFYHYLFYDSHGDYALRVMVDFRTNVIVMSVHRSPLVTPFIRNYEISISSTAIYTCSIYVPWNTTQDCQVPNTLTRYILLTMAYPNEVLEIIASKIDALKRYMNTHVIQIHTVHILDYMVRTMYKNYYAYKIQQLWKNYRYGNPDVCKRYCEEHLRDFEKELSLLTS